MDFKVCHHGQIEFLLFSFEIVLSCIFSSCVYATRKLQQLQFPVGDCNFEAFCQSVVNLIGGPGVIVMMLMMMMMMMTTMMTMMLMNVTCIFVFVSR